MFRQRLLAALVAPLILLVTLPLSVLAAGPAAAVGKCRPARSCDTTAPSVAISSPVAGALVTGDVAVAGTASDNKSVASVKVRVDGNAWQVASGTTSWSTVIAVSSLADGSHTVAAQSVDASGNVSAVVSRAFVLDRVAPSVEVSAPAAGSTVSGVVEVAGTAGDASGITGVEIRVDGGAWLPASGTSTWSLDWDTTAVTDGSHTLTARATDAAGLTSTSSRTLTVANQPPPDTTPPGVTVTSPAEGSAVTGTVQVAGAASDDDAVARVDVRVDAGAWAQANGTTTWTWPWDTSTLAPGSHTLTARATDVSGNTAVASVTVSVASTPPPDTQGTWTSPEGVRIEVSSAGPWTIAQVYDMLLANSRNLDLLGPKLTVKVQDAYASQTQTTMQLSGGIYSNFSSTVYLMGVSSRFALYPDEVLTHEYGHVWAEYGHYIVHQGDWGNYLTARWTTSDGSLTLATDSRVDSSYSWRVGEIIADDYRLLFGSQRAVATRDGHLNGFIPEPGDVPGLRDAMLAWWAG